MGSDSIFQSARGRCDGQMNLGALALPADMGLAATLRGDVGPSARVATVNMNLQLTGARLAAGSRIVHHGSLTAVVRTRITDERGRAVLEMATSHART